ncbi:hypothetical protein COEREDRAFT_85729 [Coemansia reversa NRRL 1564]|uniref:Uncharacterized protein n=1 Tax=Coemansia reversa (strain ATCC 12441 / NRRL 1564) TaxID=763665 RepID=A0A2G5BFT6_COERN|nr:hypothetical protein COEREDRAFT_85729 [Coemansia reversa NRRL 1564]|eukprot:PIA17842.1 hypothetical protein COEREDRAFT_85729 [Coemansia reversa NRRL 1564]
MSIQQLPQSGLQHGTRDSDGPIAIISTRGPSVLSASLALPRLRRRKKLMLLAGNPHELAAPTSRSSSIRDNGGSDDGEPARKRHRPRYTQRSRAEEEEVITPSSLLVADIASHRDVQCMRLALAADPNAHCLVEFTSDGCYPCIMTLCQDGFIWNQEAFLDRRSSQFGAVARRNPFMRFAHSSGNLSSSEGSDGISGSDTESCSDSDSESPSSDSEPESSFNTSSSEMVPLYVTTVHEIHSEDCPRLF